LRTSNVALLLSPVISSVPKHYFGKRLGVKTKGASLFESYLFELPLPSVHSHYDRCIIYACPIYQSLKNFGALTKEFIDKFKLYNFLLLPSTVASSKGNYSVTECQS
jgi:hypothetical protein